MDTISKFLKNVAAKGHCRRGQVKTYSLGATHVFEAYDLGSDTYIIEKDIAKHLKDRPSVLTVEKSALGGKGRGRVFAISTGNHAVTALPLLDGRFWKLSHLASSKRSEVMAQAVLCANAVDGTLELSQRELTTEALVKGDEWLIGTAGFSLSDVVLVERNEATLAHYRQIGQEWRIKPLAWTENEMRVALAASKRRIASRLEYYHSSVGVHFLTYPEFLRLVPLSRSKIAEFVQCIKELVGVYEGNALSLARMPKYRGHHEIEFFGVQRGEGERVLVPALENLLDALKSFCISEAYEALEDIVELWQSLLVRPEYADEHSAAFVENLYMNITGEIYSIVGEGATPAFDDRRTALPGATFVEGRMQMHPGADARTEVLLSNLCSMLSKGEIVEWANVYELREDGEEPLGRGATREVTYKTNLRPTESSLIEKGLSNRRAGYPNYVLARVGALRSLGVALSSYYRLLKKHVVGKGQMTDFYIRLRCEGEPLESIPASYFRNSRAPSSECREVILGLAALMGDAAAQNLAMKKFDPNTESPLFGIGKEIYQFEYDILRRQIMPKQVSICSIRGSFGWPDLSCDEKNLRAMDNFYFTHFAHALKAFQRQHGVPMKELADRFMGGFRYRTQMMVWQLSSMRDQFEKFQPDIPKSYAFDRKWRFVLWSLERQGQDLDRLQRVFYAKVDLEEKAKA